MVIVGAGSSTRFGADKLLTEVAGRPLIEHTIEAVRPHVDVCVVVCRPEVAERLTAGPGSRVYGVPSVKLAWYAAARMAGMVSRSIFWPVPNVDSALVAFERRPSPGGDEHRRATFAAVDAAFSQRRKTLRAALSGWAGSPAEAERRLRAAGLDPAARGESLTVEDFARLAASG